MICGGLLRGSTIYVLPILTLQFSITIEYRLLKFIGLQFDLILSQGIVFKSISVGMMLKDYWGNKRASLFSSDFSEESW